MGVDVSGSGTSRLLVERMRALAGAAPDRKVTILGDGQIDLLLELANSGYSDVTCRKVGRGPHLPADADLVWAPSVRREADFADVAHDAARTLKRDGLFLAGLAGLPARAHHRLQEMLEARGFVIVRRLGDVLCCRRSIQAKAA